MAEAFVPCNPETIKRWTWVGVSLGVGVGALIALHAFGYILRRRYTAMSTPRTRLALKITTPLVAALQLAAFSYEVSLDFNSLSNCRSPLPLVFSSYALAKWTYFLANMYFVFRVAVVWLIVQRNEMFFCILHTGFFVQNIIEVFTRHQLLAFQFLVLCNLHCFEVKEVLTKVFKLFWPKAHNCLKLVVEIWAITFILAGFLRAAEEWQTYDGFHPDFHGFLAPMRSFWSYVYWVFITISTVGFGDITPTTTAGQIILVFSIVFFLTWFATHITRLMQHSEQMKKMMTNDFSHFNRRPSRHLVIGCETERYLSQFLDCFPKSDRTDLLLYVNSPNLELPLSADHLGIRVFQGFDPITVVSDSKIFNGNSDSSVWLLYNPESYENPKDVDCRTITLVQKIKEAGCKARLLVSVTDHEKQALVHKVKGWRSDNGWDVCIATQILDAHMLALSAHSRILSALVAMASISNLEIEENSDSYSKEQFSHAAVTEYLKNGRIILGTIDGKSEALIPTTMNQDSSRIVLMTKRKPKYTKEPICDPQIRSTPIRSRLAVSGNGNVCINSALSKHEFLQDENQRWANLIFMNQIKPHMQNTYEFLDTKNWQNDDFIVSTLEHGYDTCFVQDCVCGTYENSFLPAAILMKAYQEPILYDLWITIIEGDHLIAEVLKVDCSYGDLFKTMLETQNKVALGVEIVKDTSNESKLHIPVINPLPDFQLKKGNLVVYLKA